MLILPRYVRILFFWFIKSRGRVAVYSILYPRTEEEEEVKKGLLAVLRRGSN